jgi:hypothetical protein
LFFLAPSQFSASDTVTTFDRSISDGKTCQLIYLGDGKIKRAVFEVVPWF